MTVMAARMPIAAFTHIRIRPSPLREWLSWSVSAGDRELDRFDERRFGGAAAHACQRVDRALAVMAGALERVGNGVALGEQAGRVRQILVGGAVPLHRLAPEAAFGVV